MKILVIYATAGAGHKKAAEAIFNRIKAKTSNDVSIIDSLDCTTPFFKFSYARGYILLISRLSFLWGLFYWLTNNRFLFFVVSLIRNFINFINSQKLRRYLLKARPQIVISTHFFANQVVSRLKKAKNLDCRLISLITDFTIHTFWLADGVNFYAVANQKLKDNLISRGVHESKIIISEIPVREEFLKPQDRGEICKRLNINQDLFTALIMTGAIGIGPIEKIVNSLKHEIQLIVVCGKNRKLLSSLSKIQNKSLKIYGLVNNVDELMSACDVIITKAGGLTVAESLVKGLPLIFFNLIPGQEVSNAKLMQSQGAGIIAKEVDDIKEVVLNLKSNPQALKIMRDKVKLIANPETLDNIINLLK